MRPSEAIKGLIAVNTGILSHEGSIYPRKGSSLPVFAYVIIHENHIVLFDAGLSPLLAANPQKYLGRILDSTFPFRTKREWTLAEQLPGIDRTMVDTIILSHRHLDHAGGVVDFNATVYIGAEEMKTHITLLGSLKGIKTQDLPKGTKLRHPNFSKIRLPWDVASSFDLFDDESIILVKTPGHTEGSLVCFLNTSPPILLAGDAFYTGPSSSRGDLLSILYYFKKHGHIFMAHDYPDVNLPWVQVIDPAGLQIIQKPKDFDPLVSE